MSAFESMSWQKDGYLVSTDPALLNLDVICELLHGSYWAANRPRDIIAESLRHSLCFGLYNQTDNLKQVGFARAVTDVVTFSWVCDVILAPAHRGKGLGKWLVACVVEHPQVAHTRSRLATADAHTLYERFGYEREEVMKRAVGPFRMPQRNEPE
jgi:GNAT superfamily N-acetyltransferase